MDSIAIPPKWCGSFARRKGCNGYGDDRGTTSGTVAARHADRGTGGDPCGAACAGAGARRCGAVVRGTDWAGAEHAADGFAAGGLSSAAYQRQRGSPADLCRGTRVKRRANGGDEAGSGAGGRAASRTLLLQFGESMERAAERIRAFAGADLEAPRFVGRKRLPTSVGGLLVHVADHTQRHTGQMVTTAKLVRASTSPASQ